MQYSELLALLGLSWSRILLYPGGLSALALAWLWRSVCHFRLQQTTQRPNSTFQHQLIACIPPLLLLSLLPLPKAAALTRQIDLPVALALLEWPVALALLHRLGMGTADDRAGEDRLAALRLGYTVLLLAVLTLAQSTGSLILDALIATPVHVDLLSGTLRVAGGAAWALALLPLLGLGAFDDQQATAEDKGESWSAALRGVGQVMLAALPWMSLLADVPLLLPLPPLLIALLLAAIHRLKLGKQRAWIVVLQGVAVLLLALLAWAAGAAISARLQ